MSESCSRRSATMVDVWSKLDVVVGHQCADLNAAHEPRPCQDTERNQPVAAEVHFVVDHAGHHRPANAVDHLARRQVALGDGADLRGPVLGDHAGAPVERHLVHRERRLDAGQVVGPVQAVVRPFAQPEVVQLLVDVLVVGAEDDKHPGATGPVQ